MESQIPSTPQKRGRIKTAAIWNTRVLKNAIDADISPLFKAVKKDEPKIANPENKKQKEKMENPLMVRAKSPLSYPTKSLERGDASKYAPANIIRANIPMSTRLFPQAF